jgi:TetR/AcrR family transcriptional regulator, transcriptional repressor for nem operon
MLATMSVRSGNGRKWTPKGVATRERIIAVAAQLIAERGVAGTTTEEVRNAAEVSSSQLYHYFKDKMALVRAVIAYQTDAVLGAQGEFLEKLDSMQALRRWRDLLVRNQRGLRCAGGCPLGSLSSEIAEIAPEFRMDLNRAFARWEDGICSGLRAMHARGELRKGADPDRLATALLAAVQGGLLLTQIRRNTKPLESAIDAMLDHIESLRMPLRHPRRSSSRSLRPAF